MLHIVADLGLVLFSCNRIKKMGTSYNPKIVTNGLILNLDYANKKCYSGSGSSSTDLKNKVIATLVNSPTYSSLGSGSILLNGTNNYITFADSTLYAPGSNDFTMEFWVNYVTYANALFDMRINLFDANMSAYFSSNKLSYYIVSSTVFTSNTTFTNNNWYNIIITKSGTLVSLYVNGRFDGSYTQSSSLGTTSRLYLGANGNNSQIGQGPANCYYSTYRYYNKSFSLSNVIQNYTATKGRFGL